MFTNIWRLLRPEPRANRNPPATTEPPELPPSRHQGFVLDVNGKLPLRQVVIIHGSCLNDHWAEVFVDDIPVGTIQLTKETAYDPKFFPSLRGVLQKCLSSRFWPKADPKPYATEFDIDDLIMSSTSYYLGRQTGNVETFCRNLAASWNRLPAHVQSYVRRVVNEAFGRDDIARSLGKEHLPLGADCHRVSWELVRKCWGG